MIAFTLLCIALSFAALAWGCYGAWQRAKANSDHWFQRAADLETRRFREQIATNANYRRPMSCRLVTPSAACWSSLDDLMRSGKADV